MSDHAEGVDPLSEQVTLEADAEQHGWRELLRPDLLGPALAQATGDSAWSDFSAELIAGGKSNLTFALSSTAGRLVLRRPPSGELLPSAHDMGREFRIQRQLRVTTLLVTHDLSEAVAMSDRTALLLDGNVGIGGDPVRLLERVRSLPGVVSAAAGTGVLQPLVTNSEKLPGSRVLDDRFMAIQQALGIPKGRETGAKYLREFIEDVKASGLVAQAIEKAGIRGVAVAPKAPVEQ